MQYNFDEIIDRQGTDALKIDAIPNIWGRNDLLPLWVADMDFATPPFILNALRKRLEHEIIGYTMRTPQWASSIVAWQQSRYGWQVQPEWLNFVPGIVPGIAFVVSCFTEPGDTILIQPPVYHPYFHVPEWNERKVVTNPLTLVNGQYEIDFEDFEKKVKECKLFLLCHPHNPGGRVWRREELVRMADICAENNVIVISDEIHADMTFKGFEHIPFATVSENARMNSITMMAASKSFNIAGLMSSFTIIPNKELRDRYNGFLMKSELNHAHIMATIATAAAFSDEGAVWLGELVDYITANVDYMQNFIKENMPLLDMIRPQASYLVFLDCRKLGLSKEQLVDFFVNKARLALNEGSTFGVEGAGFMRMNIGCPLSTLKQAMQQLLDAYNELINK